MAEILALCSPYGFKALSDAKVKQEAYRAVVMLHLFEVDSDLRGGFGSPGVSTSDYNICVEQ